jgi:hypothetical protein
MAATTGKGVLDGEQIDLSHQGEVFCCRLRCALAARTQRRAKHARARARRRRRQTRTPSLPPPFLSRAPLEMDRLMTSMEEIWQSFTLVRC